MDIQNSFEYLIPRIILKLNNRYPKVIKKYCDITKYWLSTNKFLISKNDLYYRCQLVGWLVVLGLTAL